jgi:hypothetical protein
MAVKLPTLVGEICSAAREETCTALPPSPLGFAYALPGQLRSPGGFQESCTLVTSAVVDKWVPQHPLVVEQKETRNLLDL